MFYLSIKWNWRKTFKLLNCRQCLKKTKLNKNSWFTIGYPSCALKSKHHTEIGPFLSFHHSNRSQTSSPETYFHVCSVNIAHWKWVDSSCSLNQTVRYVLIKSLFTLYMCVSSGSKMVRRFVQWRPIWHSHSIKECSSTWMDSPSGNVQVLVRVYDEWQSLVNDMPEIIRSKIEDKLWLLVL